MSLYAGLVIQLTDHAQRRADELRAQGATITNNESQANIIIVCAPSDFPPNAVIGAHLEPAQDETPLHALLRRHGRWKRRAGVASGEVVVLREEWLDLCKGRGMVVGREEQYGGWEVLMSADPHLFNCARPSPSTGQSTPIPSSFPSPAKPVPVPARLLSTTPTLLDCTSAIASEAQSPAGAVLSPPDSNQNIATPDIPSTMQSAEPVSTPTGALPVRIVIPPSKPSIKPSLSLCLRPGTIWLLSRMISPKTAQRVHPHPASGRLSPSFNTTTWTG